MSGESWGEWASLLSPCDTVGARRFYVWRKTLMTCKLALYEIVTSGILGTFFSFFFFFSFLKIENGLILICKTFNTITHLFPAYH